jgi:hypothetical protein
VTRIGANPRTRGFIVAFGSKLTGNPNDLRPVTFGPGLIDTNTFEMFVMEGLGAAASTPGLAVWARVPQRSVELIPVKIDALTGGVINAASELPVPASGIVRCNGAGFVWDDALFGTLKGRTVMVQIKGDFVPDAIPGVKPRAVDANFLLGTLPTGDGVAGGTFWSFFTLLGG